MFTPRYSLRQKYKVQVFNIITTGTVIKRTYYETSLGVNIKYTIDFGTDLIEAWEQDLDLVQGLPLGRDEIMATFCDGICNNCTCGADKVSHKVKVLTKEQKHLRDMERAYDVLKHISEVGGSNPRIYAANTIDAIKGGY